MKRVFIMKIYDFDSFKKSVNKLDAMANVDMTKPNTIFPQKTDESVADKMKKFSEVADGENPSWNV